MPVKEEIYSDEYLLDRLQEYVDKFGHPRKIDVKQTRTMPCPATYRRRFGSFSEALKMVGVQGSEIRYSDDELIELLQEKAEKMGRTPSQVAVTQDDNYPSHTTYINKFGSWAEACKLAGLEPNKGGRI